MRLISSGQKYSFFQNAAGPSYYGGSTDRKHIGFRPVPTGAAAW